MSANLIPKLYNTAKSRKDNWQGRSPYTWWKQNNRQYPAAAAVARRYLCVPATSVPSEHLFSSAGDHVLSQTGETEKVSFLMHNL